MNILILTKDGSSLGFAHKLVKEQHEVKVFSLGQNLEEHTGIFTLSEKMLDSIKDCKFVIADCGNWPRLMERLKFYNRPAIGINDITELANSDAAKQYDLFTRLGLPIPRTKSFGDLGEVVEGTIEWDARRTLIKYNNTEIRCDYRDWLAWSISKIPLNQRVIFQEIVPGYDYYLGGWFNGLKWIDLFSITPKTSNSYTGSVMTHLVSKDSKLVTETLAKLEPFLRSTGYQGPVYLTLSISERATYVLGVRFGFLFPISYSILELIENDLGEFLNAVAFSVDIEPMKTKDYVSVVQGICPEDGLSGAPILGLNDERLKHLVFHNVSKDGQDYRLARGRCILSAVAHGPSPKESADRVYRTVEAVKFPGKSYDTTLLSCAQPSFSKLLEWKYI